MVRVTAMVEEGTDTQTVAVFWYEQGTPNQVLGRVIRCAVVP